MTIQRISTIVILCAFFGSLLHGSGNPRRGLINIRSGKGITKKHDTFALNEDSTALQGLGESPELKDVNKVFQKSASIDCLSTKLQNELQDLRNLVHTIVSDRWIAEEFDGKSAEFAQTLTGLLSECISLAQKSKNCKEKNAFDMTKSLIEEAMSFLDGYSDTLIEVVEDAFDRYRTLLDIHCKARAVTDKAQAALEYYQELLDKADQAHARWKKAQSMFYKRKASRDATQKEVNTLSDKLGTMRNRNGQAYSETPAELRNKNYKLKTLRESVNSSWNIMDKAFKSWKHAKERARSAKLDAQSRLAQARNDERTAEQDACTAHQDLGAELYTFDVKSIFLLTNRGCMRKNTLGRFPEDLVIALCDALECNKDMKALVARGRQAFRDDVSLYPEFLLTLQRYVCLAYSTRSNIRTSAKGFAWELGVGLFLYDSLKADSQRTSRRDNHCFKTLGTHLTNKATDAFREFDATTSKLVVECKNLSWNGGVDKIKRQFEAQHTIAKQDGRTFVVISRKPLPAGLIGWCKAKNIAFIDPSNARNSNGFAHLLLNKGNKKLSELFQKPYAVN